MADYRIRWACVTPQAISSATTVERLHHEEGLTLQRATECLFVAHSLIVKRKKQQGAGDDPFVAMTLIKTSKNKKAAHAGPLG